MKNHFNRFLIQVHLYPHGDGEQPCIDFYADKFSTIQEVINYLSECHNIFTKKYGEDYYKTFISYSKLYGYQMKNLLDVNFDFPELTLQDNNGADNTKSSVLDFINGLKEIFEVNE